MSIASISGNGATLAPAVKMDSDEGASKPAAHAAAGGSGPAAVVVISPKAQELSASRGDQDHDGDSH